jgi:signal transduction histidine kinase
MVDAMVQGIEVVARRNKSNCIPEYQTRHKIMGDGDRLAQVINNLLSNAVKYTPSGGQVWVSLENVNAQNIFFDGARQRHWYSTGRFNARL